MNRKSFFIRLASLVVFIAIVNFFANKFYLYSSIWYFDIPMHFLGGLWLGLFFIWWFWPAQLSLGSISKVIFGVLLIGIFWEIFELVFVNYIALNDIDIWDTVSDIFLDLLGGFVAMFYFSKKIMSISNSAV